MPTSILYAYEHGVTLNGSSLGAISSRNTAGEGQSSSITAGEGKSSSITAGEGKSSSITAGELVSLIQWTDLILFDYITGHYDRVASMQDGADRENKPSILHENIRNLRQVWQTGRLVLLDNESGLLDGYELMYHGRQSGQRFLAFHHRMLSTICLFRRHTVERIRSLADRPDPARTVTDYATARDPLFATLEPVPEMETFKSYFRVRLKEVVEWISECESKPKRTAL